MPNQFALILFASLPLMAASNSFSFGPGPQHWAGDFSPIGKAEWNYQRAGYLLDRAGFGGTPEEIRKLAGMNPAAAVNYLVDYQGVGSRGLPKFEESGIFDPAMIADVEGRSSTVVETIPVAMRRGGMFGVRPNADGLRPFQPVTDAIFYRFIAMGRSGTGRLSGGAIACCSPRAPSRKSSPCYGTATSPPKTRR